MKPWTSGIQSTNLPFTQLTIPRVAMTWLAKGCHPKWTGGVIRWAGLEIFNAQHATPLCLRQACHQHLLHWTRPHRSLSHIPRNIQICNVHSHSASLKTFRWHNPWYYLLHPAEWKAIGNRGGLTKSTTHMAISNDQRNGNQPNVLNCELYISIRNVFYKG